MGSVPYQVPSHQSVYQGAGKGSQHVQGIHGGHPPPILVSFSQNYALPTTIPATSVTTGPIVIRSIILLFISWASLLFDTGASQSFISLALASSLGLKIDYLDIELHMSTSAGRIVCLNQVHYGCLLSIDDR